MSERPSNRALLWHQLRYQNLIFWRTPISALFTLVFPLIFLFVFTLLIGNEFIGILGVSTAQFYTPSLAVFGAVTATYTNLAISTAFARDLGILKRVRGTPLQPWIYLGGRIGSATWVAAISIVLMLSVGIGVYDVVLYAEAIPALIVTFLVGVACFAALGLLIAALSPTGDSSPMVANATLLPLAFISDIFIVPGDSAPEWVGLVANLFPLKHFAVAFTESFNPAIVAGYESWLDHFHWADLGVMVLWLIGGGLLAARVFTWEPRAGERMPWRRKRAEATVS
ncbi:MAG: ABC transporter permease [Acidimicrobiia bacterium]|nr:ABC transporter permease [Acidimicrobiia bacterium]